MPNSGEEKRPGDETGTDTPPTPHEFAGETTETVVDMDELPGVSATGRVQIAYMHGTRVSHSWHQSMLQLISYDVALGGEHLVGSAPFAVYCGGPNGIIEGRNTAVKQFLDKTDSDWLWFIDTDMGFSPLLLDQLMAVADEFERPVIGGLCFAAKHMGPDGLGGYIIRPVPTLFGLGRNADGVLGFVHRLTFPQNSLVKVSATGAACLLIHRSVLESMREVYGDVWFNMLAYPGGLPVAEDLSFCWRVGSLGAPIFVHTGADVSHHKEIWLSNGTYAMPEGEPYMDSGPIEYLSDHGVPEMPPPSQTLSWPKR